MSRNSILMLANLAFKRGQFERAIDLYKKACNRYDYPLREYIEFNLRLATRRLKNIAPDANRPTNDAGSILKNRFLSRSADFGNDDDFLRELFLAALGRKPQAHEERYFITNLEQEGGRVNAINQVFGSEESQRYVSDNLNSLLRHRRVAFPAEIKKEVEFGLRFPYYDYPVVSIIIPVYGKVEYTVACLKSIYENLPQVPFEIIVVDDCSPDNTLELLGKIENIILLKNKSNMGFIRSCNRGAENSKGEYLHFLNNDTQVMSGWLDELVATFSIFPECGLAGSKLLYPDGKLQEAGGIIWRDGSAWNFGNTQESDLPVFNYAREVDYISGASIMLRRDLFVKLGGFDLEYVPAYCEDSDLALKIRNMGLRVIYQPTSEVVHFEGISSGTDTAHGVKAYQIENTKKLFRRWQHLLSTHGENGKNPDNEKDRRMKFRVLVLEHCTPTPDQDAGSVSVFNIMLLMREMDFQVTFIPEDNYLYDSKYTVKLQRAGIEVLYRPYVGGVEQHLKEYGSRYDLVFMFRPLVVERNIKFVKQYAPKAKTLFYTHDIHHIRMEREAAITGDPNKSMDAKRMKEREFAAIRAVDSTIVVSTTEMEILGSQLPECNLQLLPLLLNIPGTKVGFGRRRGIVFVGGFQHTPNVDAVHFFVEKVMPHVRILLPGVKFHIVGSKPPASVLALESEDVIVEGFIEALNPFLDTMRVAVAPLRYGAGVKGKVGTAMAAGLPIIASRIAAEGMNLIDGQHVLIADSEQDFAECIAAAYENERLWVKLSQNGLEFARSAYGPNASYVALGRILQGVGLDVAPQPKYELSLYSGEKN